MSVLFLYKICCTGVYFPRPQFHWQVKMYNMWICQLSVECNNMLHIVFYFYIITRTLSVHSYELKKIKYNNLVNICLSFLLSCRFASANIDLYDLMCSFHRNPPRFQTSTPMRKHGPTTCLAWTTAGVRTPQLLPCSHGRKAAIVRPTPAQKVSQRFGMQNMLAAVLLALSAN